MKISKHIIFLTIALLFAARLAQAENEDRIHGKLTTVDGDTFEGLIRWDKNEGSWIDILNGTKEITRRQLNESSKSNRKKYGDRNNGSVTLFGIKVNDHDNWDEWPTSAESGIRFGHLQSLEVVDDDRVRLLLKSGIEVEMVGGSSDIGSHIREIVIEDPSNGETEFTWDDIKSIEFSATNGDQVSTFGQRLYGTATTRRGEEFTGFICWDVDEIFTTDVLDGENKGRTRKIRFDKIASIKRYSSNGAQLILTGGEEVLLRNSNDIDDGNRGIIVSDPGFGQVTIEWSEFEKLTLKPAPSTISYNTFDGGKALSGTVTTEDGDTYTGTIRWDNDETHSWEILDGDTRNVSYDVEFGLIKSIEKKSYRSSLVTLRDGRTLDLRGSNDVDDSNKGIFITLSDGENIRVDWEEFKKLELSN
ncbi:MAG: hypothetical protein SGI97_00685 [candidate division Zixibacteria bacterium]|mgnify:CR=1 FL=1|nr:hypothetical protein [candidate division Zixibacteria bacterium]